MSAINLQLPSQLHQKVQKRAANTNRSVEDEIIAVITNALDAHDDLANLPVNIAEQLKQLHFLDNVSLQQAAQKTVETEKTERMQELTLKQQAEGLTELETQEANTLKDYANLVMMVRAEAAVLLKERGIDITSLH